MKATTKRKLIRFGEHVVRIGSDAADILVQVRERPGFITGLALASRALNTYREIVQPQLSTYFRDWTHLDIEPLSDCIHDLCAAAGILEEQDATSYRASKVLVTKIYDVPLGWINHEQWREGPWFYPGVGISKEIARAAIGRFVWEQLGPNVRLYQPPLGSLRVVPDNLTEAMSSATADAVHDRIDRFLKAGHRRSMLLHGEPGTGKSHIMRCVARRAGGFSLRIRAREFEHVRGAASAIAILRPSAVLIDDLDRVKEPEGVLSVFEEVKASAHLFLASVNDITALDPAVLRPGRFDDLMEIQCLDPAVVEGLLEGTPPEVIDRLRKMPVAYIDEFKRLSEVLGPEVAVNEIAQLHERLEAIRKLAKAREAVKDEEKNESGASNEEPTS